MSEPSLQQAISYIYDLEKNNYLMTRAIAELETELKKPIVYPQVGGCPQKPQLLKISKTPERRRGVSALVGGFLGPSIGLVSSGLLFLFILFISGIVGAFGNGEAAESIISIAFTLIFGVLFVGFPSTFIPPVGIGVGIGLVLELMAYKKELKKVAKKDAVIEKKNQELMDEYNKQLDDFNDRTKKAQDKARSEYNARRAVLLAEKQETESRLSESTSLCQALYEKMGIDEQFRNLVPIGYMDEFLRLRIATELEGNGGLYDRVRQDLRNDQMRCTLKEIVTEFRSGINRLIDSNHRIHEQLTDINMQCDQMVANSIREINLLARQNELQQNSQKLLREVRNSSAMTEYHTARIAREEQYRIYMEYYRK